VGRDIVENLVLFLIAILCCMVCVMLRKHSPEYSFAVSLMAGILMLMAIFSKVSPVITRLKILIETANLSSDYSLILFKCLGICLLAQFSSDTCRDAGQNSLASKVEFAGKVMIVVLALPLFEKVLETAGRLLNT
jgi:stage III sporulation protein AD